MSSLNPALDTRSGRLRQRLPCSLPQLPPNSFRYHDTRCKRSSLTRQSSCPNLDSYYVLFVVDFPMTVSVCCRIFRINWNSPCSTILFRILQIDSFQTGHSFQIDSVDFQTCALGQTGRQTRAGNCNCQAAKDLVRI